MINIAICDGSRYYADELKNYIEDKYFKLDFDLEDLRNKRPQNK